MAAPSSLGRGECAAATVWLTPKTGTVYSLSCFYIILKLITVNNDDFVSRHRLLKFGRRKVLNSLGSTWDAQRTDSPYSIY